MTIQKLSDFSGTRFLDVCLTYEDVRDISNGLSEASKHNPKYQAIFAKCRFLFDLAKESMIQPETVTALKKVWNAPAEKDPGPETGTLQ